MPFIDKLGKALKSTGKVIIDTGKEIKKGIDERIEIQNKKRTLLNRFTMSDLKKICYEYGIGEPSSYEEEPFGERTKIRLTRDHYIDYVINKLNINQIEDFCHKHRMPVPDSIRQERYQPRKPSPQSEVRIEEQPRAETTQTIPTQTTSSFNEFDNILYQISTFKPEPFIDEKELQSQLKVMLEGRYPNRIAREVGTQLGGKIDFVIDRKYGIEVKPIWDKKTLQDLIGQIILYKRAFSEVGIVLCDIGKMHHSIVQEFLNEYRNQGVKTIVISGNIRSKRGRTKEVRVKF